MHRTDQGNTTLGIHIAATFTAEPIAGVLNFWMAELGLDAELTFAPFGQVFQQLLGALDAAGTDRSEVLVLLVRLADWLKPDPQEHAQEDVNARLTELVSDLAAAVRASVERRAVPHVVVVCPSPPTVGNAVEAAESKLVGELDGLASVQVLPTAELCLRYPVADWHDRYAEQIGAIPYTREGFAALGTAVARSVHAHFAPRPKVIVVDCDNTIWDGVVAEDGIDGVTVLPARRELQELLVAQVRAGRLLCLCTRNDYADVAAVLKDHPEMVVRVDHVTAIRANWEPKSENLRSLAEELSLGLDSFVFLDDSPMEIAEVRAAVPEVTALHLPDDARAAVVFLRHCWPLDHLGLTAEDVGRTRAYQQNRQREEVRRQATTLAEFLGSLELRVTIRAPHDQELDRVAQLTQRVNQFNLSGIRRTPAEVARLADGGLECLVVDVSDRFGAYGVVGVLIFACGPAVLTVDSFLLSCRALGRGVEHQMLAHLGTIAGERGLSQVHLPYLPAARNAPARDFLSGLGGMWVDGADGGRQLRLTAEEAAAVRYDPAAPARIDVPAAVAGVAAPPRHVPQPARSELVSRIATELSTPAGVLAAMAARRVAGAAPTTADDEVGPRTPTEARVMEMWASLLPEPPRSVHSNFFEIGGDSLLLVQFMGRVQREFGVELPPTTVFESNLSMAEIAAAIDETQRTGAAGDHGTDDLEDLDDLIAELQELSTEEIEALLRDQ